MAGTGEWCSNFGMILIIIQKSKTEILNPKGPENPMILTN